MRSRTLLQTPWLAASVNQSNRTLAPNSKHTNSSLSQLRPICRQCWVAFRQPKKSILAASEATATTCRLTAFHNLARMQLLCGATVEAPTSCMGTIINSLSEPQLKLYTKTPLCHKPRQLRWPRCTPHTHTPSVAMHTHNTEASPETYLCI